MTTEPRVEVLSIAGCDATPATLALVREAAAELGVTVALIHTVVATAAEAHARRFIGSPTVRVDGQDIEPASRTVLHFGLT